MPARGLGVGLRQRTQWQQTATAITITCWAAVCQIEPILLL